MKEYVRLKFEYTHIFKESKCTAISFGMDPQIW